MNDATSAANTTLVIFGATGDLATRLLYPGLFRLEQNGHLDAVRLVGTGLEAWTERQFLDHLDRAIERVDDDGDVFERFLDRWSYHPGDLTPEAVAELRPHLSETNVHYLALPPGMFPQAAAAIATSGITATGDHRLVVEKPFGIDGASAGVLEGELHRHWSESQIFRIDHFLGKETVQNLTVTRFANRVFEPLLRAEHVDQVQITVSETLGVEGRYRYYDGIGALRDMIQNHLIQLLCLAAMDPPEVWNPDVLRDHKVAVLRSVRHHEGPVDTWAVRGQYDAGAIEGRPVRGYRDEPGIAAGSATETFAAVRFDIDNWRWQGVPFYLRSGKRLEAKVSEIAYRFRQPPTQLFAHSSAEIEPNWLVFRLDQPEGIDMFLQTKTVGLEIQAETSHLHADYGTSAETITAYQQLLLDVIEGDHTSFLRTDEVDWAWRLLDPVLEAWRDGSPERYPAGSNGPVSQSGILEPGHTWRPFPA